MRALILPDADFLSRERSLLARLEIGLADEGVRVIHGVPRGSGDEAGGVGGAGGAGTDVEAPGVYSVAMPYSASGLPWTMQLRAGAFVRSLEEMAESEGGQSAMRAAASDARAVDVVHCFGGGSVRFGLSLARLCGSAAIIELASRQQVYETQRLIKRSGLGGRAMALAPDTRMLAFARTILGEKRVALASWGTHSVDTRRRARTADQPLTVVLVLSGDAAAARDAAALRDAQAAVAGLAQAAERVKEMLVFVDAAAAERTPVMQWAAQAGVQQRMTVIPQMESRRELLVQADVLLIPQGLGEQRTLVLDAIAAEMSVIALKDELVEALDDAHGVELLSKSEAGLWGEAVMAAATSSEVRSARHRLGREYVGKRRPGYAHPLAVVRAYAQIADPHSELRALLAPTPGRDVAGKGGER